MSAPLAPPQKNDPLKIKNAHKGITDPYYKLLFIMKDLLIIINVLISPKSM